jgi:thiol-disulfide isomerase/thioredoxin
MVRTAIAAAVLVSVWAAGCKEQPPSQPAEVPKAGPAAESEPGPAPSGQTEPATTNNATPAAGDSSDASQTIALADASSVPAGDVKVQILDWKQVEELIASQKGKVVVVDMWSLSCAPCRREFPNLVKLHNEKSDQVACVSVSTDYAGIKSKPVESYEPKVLEFLTEQKSTLTNVLCSTEADEVFDTLSLASIPAVYVYGKDGTLAQRFAGEEVHYDKEVLPLVDSLLAK